MDGVVSRTVIPILLLAACAAPEPARPAPQPAAAPGAAAQPSAAPAPGVAVEPAPAAPQAPAAPSVALPSNAGGFVVHYRVVQGAWAFGQPLDLDVWVASAAAPDVRLTDVALAVDAEMPEHQHGLTRVPRVERRADGSFRVEGLRFHMPGWWELLFDVTRGPWTERAQQRVDLE
jgi:hypothetical protein